MQFFTLFDLFNPSHNILFLNLNNWTQILWETSLDPVSRFFKINIFTIWLEGIQNSSIKSYLLDY